MKSLSFARSFSIVLLIADSYQEESDTTTSDLIDFKGSSIHGLGALPMGRREEIRASHISNNYCIVVNLCWLGIT